MDKEKLESEKRRWNETTLSEFLKRSQDKGRKTVSAEPVDILYTPLDFSDDLYLEKLGFPGEYPFSRGIYPNMYRGRLWTMRQYAGFGTAQQTNERFKYLLAQGQTGLSVAFDLPTQVGLDSDHPLSEGEVGKVGVAIDTLQDMEVLFEGIPLDQVSTSMTINAPAAILLAMYIAIAEKQGVKPEQLRGTIQNDILKEYIARGTYIFPPQPSMRLVVDAITYCAKYLPKWNPISISGYHIREAGSDAPQEIAFGLADAIEYTQAVLEAGMAIDDFAPQLSFFFTAHNELLEEVAKFRAARRLWARIIKERFGSDNPRSQMLRFHTQTAGSTLTAQQPDNNIVRVAIQALAAVLGGTQSLHTNSRDEALSLPTEKSVEIALRTQQIIGYESGVANTVDPLAGSYYLEHLTDRIEARAEEYIKEIDDIGGMVRAIEAGYVQREIQKSAYNYQKSIEEGERVIVGLNKFASPEKEKVDILRVDPKVHKLQIEGLKKIKSRRDNQAVNRALEEIKAAARSNENLVPYFLEAVKLYTTLGEITEALKEVFGEYKEEVIF